SRRRHTRFSRDWSSDVCSSDLKMFANMYLECGTGEHKKGGNTRITSTRGFITGTYDGPVYYSNKGCGITERRDVKIDFKIKSLRSEERRVGKECRYERSPYTRN